MKFPGNRNGNDRQRQDEFVRNVMNRTSGSPCQRAHELLPGLAGNELEELDRQLVQAHLEHCEPCRSVAVTLGWLGDLLPRMAVLDPGPDFTAAVVARTTGAHSSAEKAVRAGHTIGPAGLMDRIGRWWEKQILKPQFAMQFAYVATVVLVLLTALPVSPFRGAPEKALATMQAGPTALPGVGTAQQWVAHGSTTVFGFIDEAIEHRWHLVQEDWQDRSQRSELDRKAASIHLQGAANHLGAIELGKAGYEMMQAAKSGRGAWSNWWHGPQTNQTDESSP